MKNQLFLKLSVIAFVVAFNISNAQVFDWAHSIGSGGEDMGISVATDKAGYVYVTGYFSDTCNFNVSSVSLSPFYSKGMRDIFVAKYTPAGNFVWAKQMGGKDDDRGASIAVKDNHVYVLSTFKDTCDMDPTSAAQNLIAGGLRDIGICKLDTAGNLIWAKQVDGIGDDQGFSIKVDKQGNIIFTGIFYATPDFDPGAGSAGTLSVGWNDSFVCKWDSNGNYLWHNSWGCTGGDYAKDVAIDSVNNIYVTGEFQYITDFDGGAGTNFVSPTGWLDAYLVKYQANGTFSWVKQFGGSLSAGDTTTVRGESIEIDKNGNVFLLGRFRRKCDFNPGAGVDTLTPEGKHDVFLTKMDTSGTYHWTKKWGGPMGDDMPSRMAMDHLGNLYVVGYFYGTADFDPSNATSNLYASGSWDVFIQALRSNGALIWAASIGGNLFDTGTGIAVDNQGSVYSTGGYQLGADFDTGAGNLFLNSNGLNDVFIHKIKQPNVGVEENQQNLLFQLYPNPASSVVTIVADSKLIGSTYCIYDVTGREIKKSTIQNVMFNISVETLNSGMYYIVVNSVESLNSVKFIKN